MFGRKSTPVRFAWHYHPANDETFCWSENDIQSYIVDKFRQFLKLEPEAFLFHADQGGIRVKPNIARKAKALGLESGVPDLFIMLPLNHLVCIELKTRKGSVNQDQKSRHKAMLKMGYAVHVVKAKHPVDGWDQVYNILKGHGV